MADQVHVNLDGIDEVTRRMRPHADDLVEALKSLQSVLTAHDGCWGTDDIGKGFEENYSREKSQAMKNGQDMVNGYDELPDNLTKTAKDFVGLDSSNAAALDQQTVDTLNNPPPPPPAGGGS